MFNKRRLLANQHSAFRGNVIYYYIHGILNCVVAIIYMTHFLSNKYNIYMVYFFV